MANFEPVLILKEGDTLTVPRGFTVEFRGSRVCVYGPNNTAESRRGFCFGDFLTACGKKGCAE